MKRSILIVMFSCFFIISNFAQKSQTTVLNYVVKANSSNYRIFPEDNYLFVGKKNCIKILIKGKNKISTIKVSNGRILKTKIDTVYIIDNLKAGICLLSMYEKAKNGKNKLIQNKQYKVIDYPIISINNVKSDSSISKLLLCGGIVKARYDRLGIEAQVVGFKMDILENDTFITDSSTNDRLTKKMRLYVNTLKEGSLVYMKDVKYVKANGTMKIDPIFRLFLGKEEKTYYEFNVD